MERDYKLLLIGVLVFAVLFITLVLADIISTPTTEFNFNQSISNYYNITIDKTGVPPVNITWINITLPDDFTYQAGTNETNASALVQFNATTNGSGNVVLTWNLTTPGVMNSTYNKTTFGFNATSPNPGNFTIYIATLDNASQVNTTHVHVFINDTVYPEITIVSPSNNSNLSSATFDLNYTFVEYDSNLAGALGYCWYSNNSGIVNSSILEMGTNLTNETEITWTEGLWNVTVWCNDTQNNVNFTGVSFTIDTTAPTVSYSCTQEIVSHGATLTCSCSTSDTGGSGVETTTIENPDTQQYGTQTITCTAIDHAGNSAAAGATFYVISGGGGTSSVGGYVNTFVEDAKEFSEIKEITKSLGRKNRIRIKINNQEHYIGVQELTTTSATIEVSSTSQVVVFNIGDEKKFDVTEDGYYDLKVKLNSIESEKADVTITSINEKIPEDKDKGIVEKAIDTITKEGSNAWIWILVVIVLVVIIVVYFLKKKK